MLFSLSKKKLLNIIKYNKQTQIILDININNYKKYCEIYSPIEIEIIPKKNKYDKFINMEEKEEYYHIYFNNNKKEEIKINYLNENENVLKINIIIDYQVK